MGVTNVSPQSKSRTPEAVPFFSPFFLMFVHGVCEDVCASTGFSASDGITGTTSIISLSSFFSSSPSCTHWTVLSVCLCVLTWRECGQALLAELQRAVKTPFLRVGDMKVISGFTLCLSSPLLLHALFHFNTTSHSFQADKKHQSGLSIAKTHISHILSNFLLIFSALCQKAGVLCFDDCLDRSLKPFSPAKFDLFKHCLHWLRAYISWNHSSLSLREYVCL